MKNEDQYWEKIKRFQSYGGYDTFYVTDDLAPAEDRECKSFWSSQMKELTRGQVTALMADNRDPSSPIFRAGIKAMYRFHALEDAARAISDEQDAWATATPERVRALAKKRGKSERFIKKVLAHRRTSRKEI